MAKRDDYENTFRKIEDSLGSSSGKNPVGEALERDLGRKASRARAKETREKARSAKGK
jgi:hypothetical protein